MALGDINLAFVWEVTHHSFTQLCRTHLFVTHTHAHTGATLSRTALSYTHTTFSHTTLPHTILFSRTTLCLTKLFHIHTHTPLSHTQLFHTHTHNVVTCNAFHRHTRTHTHTLSLSHRQLFHTQLFHIRLLRTTSPPPSPLCFQPRPSHFHTCLTLLEETDMWASGPTFDFRHNQCSKGFPVTMWGCSRCRRSSCRLMDNQK